MASLLDELAKNIRTGISSVAAKTEELTKIGKIKVEILGIKRNIEKNFTELGGKVYHLIVEEKDSQVASNAEIKKIIDQIKDLEKQLRTKNQELEQVKVKEGTTEESSKPKSTKKKAAPAQAKTKSQKESS